MDVEKCSKTTSLRLEKCSRIAWFYLDKVSIASCNTRIDWRKCWSEKSTLNWNVFTPTPPRSGRRVNLLLYRKKHVYFYKIPYQTPIPSRGGEKFPCPRRSWEWFFGGGKFLCSCSCVVRELLIIKELRKQRMVRIWRYMGRHFFVISRPRSQLPDFFIVVVRGWMTGIYLYFRETENSLFSFSGA